MKGLLKKALASSIRRSGLLSLVRSFSPVSGLTVLMFHKVDPAVFEKQVAYIKKYYVPVSEEKVLKFFYEKKPLPAKAVLLTFDDGYLNNYEYAWPVLRKYEVPALIFLVTSLIGQQKMAWYDQIEYVISHSHKKELSFEGKRYRLSKKGRARLMRAYYFHAVTTDDETRRRLVVDLTRDAGVTIPKCLPKEYAFMSWDQAREMLSLVSFSAHTHTHPILPSLSSSAKRFELEESFKRVKKELRVAPLSICYPNGDYDEEVVSLAKDVGFKLGFSSNFGRNVKRISPFLIQRIGANVNDSADILAVKLSRLSNVFKGFKTRKHFKVIMVSNYYLPQTGGITTVVHELVTRLRKKKVPVSVFAYPQLFRSIEGFFDNNRFVHKLLVVLFFILSFLYLFFQGLWHRKIVVHSHSAGFCARVGWLAHLLGLRSVHTFHTHVSMHKHGHSKRLRFMDSLDYLTAVSDDLGKSSAKEYGIARPVKTIYNGAPAIVPVSHKMHDRLRVLYVGHLFDVKDPLLFVKSMQELAKKTPVEAVMVGDGFLREELESYIVQHDIDFIRLLGSQPSEKVSEWYAWADVFLLTSKAEGLGVVLLEAMAHGVPVVSTVAGGAAEIVQDGVCGLLVRKRDPDLIAKSVLLAHKNASKFRKEAYVRIQDVFDWDAITNKYLNIYRRLTFEKNFQSSEEIEG